MKNRQCRVRLPATARPSGSGLAPMPRRVAETSAPPFPYWWAKVHPTLFISLSLMSVWFISGCNMAQHHHNGASEISSEKVLVTNLSEKTEYQPLLTGKPQTRGMRSGRVHLLPGQSVGEHSTKAHEEMLIFLSGKGVALIGNEQKVFEIGQGKVCYIPPHTIHDMKNTGTEPFVYIYCVAPVKY